MHHIEVNGSYRPVQSEWPTIDFLNTPLREVPKRQLNSIYLNARQNRIPAIKLQLLDKIIGPHLFDAKRGLYMPLAKRVNMERKLPDRTAISATNALAAGTSRGPLAASYFTNALRIPEGYEKPGFEAAQALFPIQRVANCGFLVVTIEYDCRSPSPFEQNLEWTRGKGGDFNKSAFAEVDRQLCQFKDYRGFSIVFSGNKSFHFHFVFSVAHFENCPVGQPAESPTDCLWKSRILAEAHNIYYDHLNDLFVQLLNPEIAADKQLRSITQYRRVPWGIRELDKDSNILGLPAGSLVPQLVIHENIRGRASADAQDFLVASTFSASQPSRTSSSRKRNTGDLAYTAPPQEMQTLRDMCIAEWGSEYPHPVSIQFKDGEWVIHFKNRPDDKTPSTVARGPHRKLHLQGHHDFKRDFFLPEEMTADELGGYLSVGWQPLEAETPALDEDAAPKPSPSLTPLERLKQNAKLSPKKRIEKQLTRAFTLPISGDVTSMKESYQEKLAFVVSQVLAFRWPILLNSVEGIGKSTILRSILSLEAFDAAANEDDTERFLAISFRSKVQAHQRAEELREEGVPTIVLLPFWEHLTAVCEELELAPLGRDDFPRLTLNEIFKHLKSTKPSVYEGLEAHRKRLWSESRFDGGTTILFMTHKSAEHWTENQTLRAWHHPSFSPENTFEQNADLARRFQITDLIFDDPEVDEFVHIMSEEVYRLIEKQRSLNPDWKNGTRDNRQKYFNSFVARESAAKGLDFEQFNSLMRLDFSTLQPYCVEFDKLPYGQDNGNGIYHQCNGRIYYLGRRSWITKMNTRCVFLTTEQLVSNVIEKAYQGNIIRLDLNKLAGLSLQIPLRRDKRARRDQKGEEETISSLIKEITESDPNSLIIADGAGRKMENVVTFQSMKGRNDFADKNIFIILTWMAPEKYAQLNVLGQWLDDKNILSEYLNDNINQAVGRNKGFREKDFEATVICSKYFYTKMLKQSDQRNPRTKLYIQKQESFGGVSLTSSSLLPLYIY